MSDHTEELKDRIEAKRKRLEAKIHELKADGRAESREQADNIEKQLKEITDAIKGGYDNMKESTAETLNKWLKD